MRWRKIDRGDMRPVAGTVTTDFFEPRPISNPGEHVHGAIDIGAPINTPIYAPEGGEVMAWCAYRIQSGTYWPDIPIINGNILPYCNYFYDTYGGVLILRAKGRQRTHVITHSYSNQLFNKGLFQDIYTYEEKEDSRFPFHAVQTGWHDVRMGAHIGYVGNAGYSTGPHVHWEIHHGWKWNRWEDRINPERWEI
jgi:hypothetical protein